MWFLRKLGTCRFADWFQSTQLSRNKPRMLGHQASIISIGTMSSQVPTNGPRACWKLGGNHQRPRRKQNNGCGSLKSANLETGVSSSSWYIFKKMYIYIYIIHIYIYTYSHITHIYTYWIYPLPTNSHHQDYMFGLRILLQSSSFIIFFLITFIMMNRYQSDSFWLTELMSRCKR